MVEKGSLRLAATSGLGLVYFVLYRDEEQMKSRW